MKKFKLETITSINKEQASLLVGKHIHFSWHDKNTNTICNIPGKVIDYLDNKLRIYTNDILMIDDSDNVNKMIYDIELDDISNVHIFDVYNEKFQELYDCIDEERLGNVTYTITNVYNQKLKIIITDFDSLSIYFIYEELGEKKLGEYPVYLLSDIKK